MTEFDEVSPPQVCERLPLLPPSEMTSDQRALYDAILAGDRASDDRPIPLRDADGHLAGPFNAMLYAPALGRLLESTGRTLRYESSLPPRLREIAILAVAASEGCSYEWAVHGDQALRMGMSEQDLEVIAGGAPGLLSERGDQQVLTAVREILANHELSDPSYTEIQKKIGDTGMLELIVLVSHYRLLALILRLFTHSPSELPATPNSQAGVQTSISHVVDRTLHGDLA